MDTNYLYILCIKKEKGLHFALNFAKKYLGKRYIRVAYETDSHYVFRNIAKYKMDLSTVRDHQIQDGVSMVYGKLISQTKKDDTSGSVSGDSEGTGETSDTSE